MKPLSEQRKIINLPVDCGSSSCEFTKDRSGMRTNGGCRCASGTSFTNRKHITLKLQGVESDWFELVEWTIRARELLEQISQRLSDVCPTGAEEELDMIDRLLEALPE